MVESNTIQNKKPDPQVVKNDATMPDGCVAVFLGILAGLFIFGPLGTGIGLIFGTFFQALGIGIVSCVSGAIVVAIALSAVMKGT